MAAASLEHEKSLLTAEPATDMDIELSEEPAAVGARQPRPRGTLPRRVALAVALAVGLVGASALVLKQQRLVAGDVSSLQVEAEKAKKDDEEPIDYSKGVPPFKKCGGQGWVGPTKCVKGCACVIQSRYFSQCSAPGGGMHCDVDKAKAEVMAAKEKSMEAKPESEDADKELKAAREKEMEAKEELRKASAELDKRTMEGRHVRNQKLVVEREVKHKELVAKRAAKAAADKLKEYNKVKDEVDGLNKTNALREHGQCRAMFGDCGPVAPPKLTKNMACCIEGCVCKWKGAFYAQCSPPPGKGGCDPAGEREHIKERTETMEKLKRQSELLESRRVSSKKSYEEADEKANDIRHKAAQAGTRRVQAHAVMMKKKSIARSLTNIARRKARMAIHKKHKVHYTEIAVKAWEAAAGED